MTGRWTAVQILYNWRMFRYHSWPAGGAQGNTVCAPWRHLTEIPSELMRYFSRDQKCCIDTTCISTLGATKACIIVAVVTMHVITQKQGETNKSDWHASQAAHWSLAADESPPAEPLGQSKSLLHVFYRLFCCSTARCYRRLIAYKWLHFLKGRTCVSAGRNKCLLVIDHTVIQNQSESQQNVVVERLNIYKEVE